MTSNLLVSLSLLSLPSFVSPPKLDFRARHHGVSFSESRCRRKASRHFREALKLRPNWKEAMENLAALSDRKDRKGPVVTEHM